MNFIDILKLSSAALIPVILSIAGIFTEKNPKFSRLHKHLKFLIYGVIFGGCSILGTVLGAPLPSGAVVNVRDAAPIIGGLLFGGPVGIIAGFIGGGYRALTPLWAPSTSYTVIACSISTALSGIFTALIRHLIFDDKRGTWYYGFFLGVLVEDFHMMLTILTHTKDLVTVYNNVIKSCAFPMILINSLAVMIAILIISFIDKQKNEVKGRLSTKVQVSLIISLAVSYLCTALFSNISINQVVKTSVEQEATQIIEDVKNDVDDSVDNLMVRELDQVSVAIKNINNISDRDMHNAADVAYIAEVLQKMTSNYNISEINILGRDNIITFSSAGYEGFNMADPENVQANFFANLVNEQPKSYKVQEFKLSSSNLYMKYAAQRFEDLGNDQFYYFQIGVDTDKYINILNDEIKESAVYRHIKDKGYIIVSDDEGNIISASNTSTITTIDFDKVKNNEYKEYYTYLEHFDVKLTEDLTLGYNIIAYANAEESDLPSKISFAATTLVEIFVFLLLYCVLYIRIKRRVVDKIKTVSAGLNEISSGDLNIKINETSTVEFESLSNDINKTVDTLKNFIKKEADKNAEELAFAKNIQYSVLPAVFPMNNKFEIYASMKTAKTVGGDFYDLYYIDREHVLIEIADVSGKGIPAAMFMMRAKTLLKSLIESGMDLDVAFIEANKRLCEGNDTQTFITVWAGVVDLTNGHVEFVNAGHNPPVICRDGKFEYLRSRAGFVLAGLDGFKYQKQSFDIKPGDIIYLYTDGVTEANNEEHELYGEDRLLNALDNPNCSTHDLCDKVSKNVKEFVNGAEQSDDITMLAFKLYNVENTNIKVVDAEIKNLPEIMEFIDDLLDRNGASMSAKSQIDVAVDEIFSNISFYAYPKGQVGKAKVSVIMSKDNEEMTIIFEDRGRPYNPLEKDDPDTTLSLEEKSIGGLGIFIVKKTMDSMEYENVNGHNVLTLKKKIH